MFSCHNYDRGEISETDTISGAMAAAYVHLVEDGEIPPIVICEDNEPVACVSWLPVGRGKILRYTIAEGRRES